MKCHGQKCISININKSSKVSIDLSNFRYFKILEIELFFKVFKMKI